MNVEEVWQRSSGSIRRILLQSVFFPFALLVAMEFRFKTVPSVLQSSVGNFTRLTARNVASFRVANHFFDRLPGCLDTRWRRFNHKQMSTTENIQIADGWLLQVCASVLQREKHDDGAGLFVPYRIFVFIGHFPQKLPVFSGSFVENDLQLRGSYIRSCCRKTLVFCVYLLSHVPWYGVATISRLLNITGLFCKRAL